MRYAKPYWVYAVVNVIFNIIVILFSLVSFGALIPILQILFEMSKPVTSAPPFAFNQDSIMQNINFYISELIAKYSEITVLAYICILLVALYFLKNLFWYFVMYFISIL